MPTIPPNTPIIKVGFVDDHILSWSLGIAVVKLGGLETVLVAKSGEEALQQLAQLEELPDILLMDIKMDGLGGIETTRLITEHYPSIKTIAFTAIVDAASIINMINAGAKGYYEKDFDHEELKKMLSVVYHNGWYPDLYQKYRDNLRPYQTEEGKSIFTKAEITYLKLVCKGHTIREIAKIMNRAPHTIEYYRRSLFQKLRVDSVVLMVLDALRIGLIDLELFPDHYEIK